MSALLTNTPSFLSGVGTKIGSFFVRMIENRPMARDAEARGAQITALNAKTDAELAAMGLKRNDIPTYVFRDLMHR